MSIKISPRPLISIAVPAFNAGQTIREAIESVLAQTYANFELIICDDASTDETVEIIEGYSDDRIRLIKNDQNCGEGAARDSSMYVARGEWIAVLDADDAWHTDRLRIMLDAVSKDDDRMVFDDILECHHTRDGLKRWRRMRGEHAFGARGIPINVPVASWVGCKRLLIKPLIPMRVLRSLGIRHSTRPFAADTEFFLKLLANGLKLRYVPGAYYYYRITPNSATGTDSRYSNMKEVLENAIADFSGEEKIISAIKMRLEQESHNESYFKFLWSLEAGDLGSAARYALSKPWVAGELFTRILREIPYHVHRAWHRGSGRNQS